ncbi:MAG: DUF4350 domain-containing protein [Rhodoglobus sp.]
MTGLIHEQRTLSPSLGKVAKRSLFWVGAVVFLVIIALVALATVGSQAEGKLLDSTNAAPEGARAVAEVLRQQGVDVVATSSLAQSREAVRAAESTTLFLYDPQGFLDDEQLAEAVSLADTVVIADAGFDQLQQIAPEVAQAGAVDETLRADCSLTAVQKAETVSGGGSGYRVIDDSSEVTSCLGSGDKVFSLVQLEQGSRSLILLGATGALTNERVSGDGNAALALNLLGGNDQLVWYLPSVDDVTATVADSEGASLPPWVTPVMGLLVLTVIAAAVWRGRRFGPLVIENLPVTVRSNETMLGRARLYEKSSSRLRALDSLRVGSLRRLTALCGLPRTASVDEVIAAVAAVTGAQRTDIRRLLVDAEPATDAELMSLSDALLLLERHVATAVRP